MRFSFQKVKRDSNIDYGNISTIDHNVNISINDNNYNENTFSAISDNSSKVGSEFIDYILKKEKI